MRVWILVVLASCDAGGPPPKSPTSPRPLPIDAAPVADAAVVVVDATPDAAPAAPTVDVRPSVRAAPPWIARKNILRPKIGSDTVVTYELRREGDQALLVAIGGTTNEFGFEDPTEGPKERREREKARLSARREWRLSVVENGTKLTFSSLNSGDEPPIAECTRTTLAVVRADAKLTLKNEDACGSEPFWKPKTTKRVTVLSCSDVIAFAAAPGVEWYYVHGDCEVGGGWRALPTP